VKYILTLEAYYKKRGLIGKAVDWAKGRKDFNDLIEGQNRLGKYSKVYSINKNDISKINKVSDDVSGTSKVINWTENNPGSFLIFGLSSYQNTSYRYQLIKFKILIKDLLDVVDKRLEILSIGIDVITEYDDFEVTVLLKEDDWEEGDGMPDDIYDDYVKMISDGLEKKKKQYISDYNILQSQETPQKLKNRSIRLYNLRTGYQSKYDDDRGLLWVKIDPRM
jgi:hypothetical protein